MASLRNLTRPKALNANRSASSRAASNRAGHERHEHRTAKVVEIIGTSPTSFEDAIRCALDDARQTTRGITGAHVLNWSVRCNEGEVVEYKVDLKVAFGIERT